MADLRFARAQTPALTVLYDFTTADGSYPTNALLLASDQVRRKFFEFDDRFGGTPAHASVKAK